MSFDACAALVERGDPDRFLAAMAAPLAARRRLMPLYALNVEVARAPWVTQEPLIAGMRLQWWRDVVTEAQAGAPPRAHEVATPLAEVIQAVPACAPVLDAMIAARDWDVYGGAMDRAALWTYLDATAGGLMWASALALGDGDEPAARAAGRAQGLANWCLAVPALRTHGKHPLDDEDVLRDLAREALDALPAPRTAPVAALRAAWLAPRVLSIVARGQAARRPSEGEARLRLMVAAARGRWRG